MATESLTDCWAVVILYDSGHCYRLDDNRVRRRIAVDYRQLNPAIAHRLLFPSRTLQSSLTPVIASSRVLDWGLVFALATRFPCTPAHRNIEWQIVLSPSLLCPAHQHGRHCDGKTKTFTGITHQQSSSFKPLSKYNSYRFRIKNDSTLLPSSIAGRGSSTCEPNGHPILAALWH